MRANVLQLDDAGKKIDQRLQGWKKDLRVEQYPYFFGEPWLLRVVHSSSAVMLFLPV